MTALRPAELQALGLVAIGRNEGPRLARCLSSVEMVKHRIYVDSGSTDNSLELARSHRVTVLELSTPPRFTAARARNAGLERLLQDRPELEFVQMIDGDCELQPGWLQEGLSILRSDPTVGVVFGRLRERYPEGSIYNAMCDDEWNLPLGENSAMLGIVLCRIKALRAVGFYNSSLIAGEDSELALRLRLAGWRVLRVRAEMALHDAAIYRFSQWWQRTRRSGHCFAELATRYSDSREPGRFRSLCSVCFWGAILPATFAASAVVGLWANQRWMLGSLAAFAMWIFQIVRIARNKRRTGLTLKTACTLALLLVMGKVPQFLGSLKYFHSRIRGIESLLIEYKQA